MGGCPVHSIALSGQEPCANWGPLSRCAEHSDDIQVNMITICVYLFSTPIYVYTICILVRQSIYTGILVYC